MAKKKTYGRRAARGEGHIRQRKDGRWEYIYTNKAGETKSAYGTSEADVLEKKRAIQSALYEGIYVDPSAHTVSTWADYFFSELYIAPNVDTRAGVRGHLENHIKPFFKAMKLQDVDDSDVVRFHKHLLGKDLAVKTIRNIHGTLYQLFDSAIPKRIKVNPAKGGVKFSGYQKPEMRVFTEDEQFDFEDLLNDATVCPPGEHFLFLFALLTGMREGELLGLDWKHVDFTTGTIHIHQQIKQIRSQKGVKQLPNKQFLIRVIDDGYYLAPPKHQIKRSIRPGQRAMDVLRKAKTWQKEQRLLLGTGDAFNPHRFVFVDYLGDHFAVRTIIKHFKALAAKVGAPEMRVHDLRHTYSRNSLAAGNTFDQISEVLGHSSVDFTKKQYGHFPDALHIKSGENMDAYEFERDAKRIEREAKKRQKSQAT